VLTKLSCCRHADGGLFLSKVGQEETNTADERRDSWADHD